jgi:hypothetical protein
LGDSISWHEDDAPRVSRPLAPPPLPPSPTFARRPPWTGPLTSLSPVSSSSCPASVTTTSFTCSHHIASQIPPTFLTYFIPLNVINPLILSWFIFYSGISSVILKKCHEWQWLPFTVDKCGDHNVWALHKVAREHNSKSEVWDRFRC